MRVETQISNPRRVDSGTTLVELLIAMVVALVAIAAVYSVYTVQQRNYGNQRLLMSAQQDLRGALLVFEQYLRMAGYDPVDTDGFGLVDIRRYDIVDKNELDIKGEPVLFFTCDENEDGVLEGGDTGRNKEHPKFRVSDIYKDGRPCLTLDIGSGRQPLSENIRSIGFAYAVDRNNDGYPDRWNDGSHWIWAVDSDNDNLLDTHIDTNDDGLINQADDVNQDGRIDRADGGQLIPQVPLDRVRAVRIWLMAVTARPLRNWPRQDGVVVADRILSSTEDGRGRLVFEALVSCRNL